MNIGRFKRIDIRELVSWVADEAALVQWAGSAFSWPLTQTQFRRHLEAAKREEPTLYRMLRAVMEYGFCKLDLNRIALGVFDFNQTAIRCYETMGFIREGTLREPIKVGEEFWDCHIMSILRKEWERKLVPK